MKPKECSLIQEILPLYVEDLVNQETVEYIKEHLAACADCAQEWENFIRPLPDPLPREKLSTERGTENKLFARLKKTVIAVVLLVVMGGAGLAYASYNAGKNVGLDDPSYRFAKELDLFTEIRQSRTVDGIQVNIEQGLFDSTRSVLFLNFSAPVKDIPHLNITDESGLQYEMRSSKGWQNKYFIFEFEPLALEAQNISLFLTIGDQARETSEFTIPVDVVKTAQYTTIIYPNQEKQVPNLRITLDKAVLGVSEAEFRVRFDWPVDGSVDGISLGRGTAYFPTSVREAPDTLPPPGLGAPPPGGLMSGYAATFGINYRPEEPPENRPALYDLTGRQEVKVEGGEYRTTQFPCQVLAILKFAPVKQDAEQLELLLPPVYLYKKIESSPNLYLSFEKKNELNLEQSITLSQGKLIIEKVWLEKNQICLSYHIEASFKPETILPHFELVGIHSEKQGQMRFDREKPQVIVFALFDEGAREFYLNLDSIGQLLPREKFAVDMREE